MALTLLAMASAQGQNYSYGDGSANLYRITPNELSYSPVKKEASSSGVYSGGTAQRVRLSDAEFRAISQLLDKAIADTRAHTDKRVMMSGAISRDTGAAKSEVLLSPDAPVKARLEARLVELLKRGSAAPKK